MIGDYLLPPSNALPPLYQELCAIMKHIGIEYQSLDAFPQDHIIYHKEHESAKEFLECHTRRYQDDQVTKKVSRKVLHYIPIIPRLKWLLRCSSLAQFMDYHAGNRSWDDIIWMPMDGSTFMDIEKKWSHFKEEPQNLKLSLATNGVNPFREIRSVYLV